MNTSTEYLHEQRVFFVRLKAPPISIVIVVIVVIVIVVIISPI